MQVFGATAAAAGASDRAAGLRIAMPIHICCNGIIFNTGRQ
jgi:hypothetical protein